MGLSRDGGIWFWTDWIKRGKSARKRYGQHRLRFCLQMEQ